MNTYKIFFSISSNFILVGKPLAYDLFVNSSSLSEKEKFVRIFPMGGILTNDDLIKFKNKYHQLYVPEEQRSLYLKSLVNNKDAPDTEKAKAIKDSAIYYLETIFDKNKEFTTEVLKETIQGCRDSVESMVDMLQEMDVKKIQDLIADLSFHDFYTYDHSINVAMYCIGLFKELKPNAKRVDLVEVGMGGLLHDLGKIKIPNHIINNPGKLSDNDFIEIKKHPGYGIDLINKDKEALKNFNLELVKRVIHEHHENFNGTGYPSQLEGNQIHLYARIAAIADFFDALTTKRSYHEVLSTDEALNIMAKSIGKKIDPKLFDVFVKHLKKIKPSGHGKLELPDDFDPCQPHQELPFQKENENYEDPDFGKVKFDYGFAKKNLENAQVGKFSINKQLLDKISEDIEGNENQNPNPSEDKSLEENIQKNKKQNEKKKAS